MELGLFNTIQSAIFLFLDLYICIKAYRKRKINEEHRYFTEYALLASVQQLASVFVRMMKSKLVAWNSGIQYAVYITMFIAMVFTAMSTLRYLLYLSGHLKKQKTLEKGILLLPCIVMTACALVSPWTHSMFYLDASLEYHRGPLFLVQVICPCLYAVAGLLLLLMMLILRRKTVGTRILRYFLCFILPAIAGMVLQTVLNVDGGYSAIGASICAILLYLEFYIDEIREIEHRKEEQLQEELLQNNARLFALEDDFESLYDVELESGRFVFYDRGEFYRKNVSEKLILSGQFFENMRENIDRVVFEEDRDGVFEVQQKDHIRKNLEEKDHIDHYYRILTEDGGPKWFKMRVVYKDESKKNVIIGIFNAEKSVEAQQLVKQKEQLEESLTFTDYFLNTYISAYYIDLETRKFTVYKAPETELGKSYLDHAEYLQPVTEFLRQVVHPDDLDGVLAVIQPEAIREAIGRGESSYSFRVNLGGAARMIRMQIIRGTDENHAAIGFRDVTEEYEAQKRRLLGAVPLSNDVLVKAKIGLWAFELDEGQPPRMYGDDAMLGLLGLAEPLPPEEIYHAWYDHIDEGSYDLVTDAVAKMSSGEHAEVQYPWHCPDGHTIMVRCGGVRNYGYRKGIRIEGTHQNVTQTLHFDEEERKRAKQLENDLIISKLRADSLAYIADNEPDLDNAIQFFGERILQISGCDQVIFRETDGHRIVLNAPGIEDIPQEICNGCPFADFDRELYGEDGTVLMNDCREGCRGVMPPEACPAKSSFMQHIYSGGRLVGLLTIHYLNEPHTFTENGIGIMKIVATYLGLLIGRINEKKADIARIEAESSNRAKTEFLFNMSHDIRTPMNAILGYTDIGLRHVDDAERSSASFLKIKAAGGHLLSLINDILEMSRIESGKIELTEMPLDVKQTAEKINMMSQALAIPKSIDFKTVIGDLPDPYVYADELHVNEILINLISNAVKYTPEGGKVRFELSQLGGVTDGKVTFRFEVTDTGIGMSEEFQTHLYEAFSREKTSTVSRIEGTGLGLSIVKKIVDMMGGDIRVKSRPGEGSVFTVEIPFRGLTPEERESFRSAKQTDEDVPPDVLFAGKKVLLVEDNEMNAEIANEILSDAGLAVDDAADGELALKAVMEKGTGYYDFILMDVQMPVMNGYEATEAIRALPNGSKVPIIAVSANAFDEDKKKSLEAGMDAHVAKPINIGELFRVLARFL